MHINIHFDTPSFFLSIRLTRNEFIQKLFCSLLKITKRRILLNLIYGFFFYKKPGIQIPLQKLPSFEN